MFSKLDKYNNINEKYLDFLQSTKNEREIHSFLKSYPLLVRNAFNAWAWNHVSVIPEFKLNNDYRVDFLVLSADSGQWFVNIVELKSPTSKPFTKDGLYSKSLNQAIKQISERITWIKQNDFLFRKQLSIYFKKKKVPAHCSNADDHIYAATEIMDYRTCISYQYFVVIGRRSMIPLDFQHKRHLFGTERIQIATYDRLAKVGKQLDLNK